MSMFAGTLAIECWPSRRLRLQSFSGSAGLLLGSRINSCIGRYYGNAYQAPRPRPCRTSCPFPSSWRKCGCKYPPAKPEALRLLAPQRGLIATGESKSKNKSKGLTVQTLLAQSRQNEGEHTPGTVKLLLPPRQSRGISQIGRAHV